MTRSPGRALMVVLAVVLAVPPASHARQYADVEAAVRAGIRQGVFPGAAVVIGRRDTVLYARGFGRFTWAANSAVPSADSTLWDVASLTKVVATASVAMRLADRGQLDLDTPVARFLPRFTGGGRERVTVRMLLDHTSGLPAFAPLYQDAETREAAIARLWEVPLRRLPGRSPDYSDLNAILLALAMEAITGQPFDELVHQEVFEPLGMTETLFAPPASLRRRIAPSMRDSRGPIAGRPSDPNAFALGGVAGHAGVFATAADLARFAQAWLRQGHHPGGGTWVSPLTLRQFLERGTQSGTRMLGWDSPRDVVPRNTTTSFGSLATALTYGHTGWSGTSMWIDPASDLFMILLTNRSYDPRVRNSLVAIRDVRHAVSNAARTSVLAQCQLVAEVRC
ncbi:MAG: serine hydrolase domain-containing protein [Gemmatimonadales bacterium]